MYSFFKLCKSNQDFIFSFTGTPRARSEAVSFAIASVLVNAISFIKEPEKKHFDPEHVRQLTNALSVVNEMFRIDIDMILGYAQKLYNYRLSFLAGEEVPNPVYSPETAIIDCFGISRFFSKDDLKMISENGIRISIDMLAFRDLFNAMNFFQDMVCRNSVNSPVQTLDSEAPVVVEKTVVSG